MNTGIVLGAALFSSDGSSIDDIVAKCRLMTKAHIEISSNEEAYCLAAEEMQAHNYGALTILVVFLLATFAFLCWKT